jgi:predicted secreted hydrolase
MKKLLGRLYHSLVYQHSLVRPLSCFKARKNKEIVLPEADSFFFDQEIQWWYWTGHLQDDQGKRYGFEMVFFAFDSWVIFKNQLAQAAISDIDRQSYHYREAVEFLSLPKKLNGKFYLGAGEGKREVMAAFGGNGRDCLYCEIDDYILDISLEAVENPVFHYGGKAHPYSFGGYTYYYARERMKTRGVLKIGGKTLNVEGVSWFDRQYGDLYQAIFKGWQWFAIELFDGRSIMLYDFLGKDCLQERFGSINGSGKHDKKSLSAGDFEVFILDMWQCPRTNIKFPSGWKVRLEGLELRIEPLLKDQALTARHHFWIGPEYWEGACNVFDRDGRCVGQAYVELNGFGHKLISFEAEKLGMTDFGI